MFFTLGRIVTRWWLVLLVAWILVLVGSWYAAPNLDDVVDHGEFSFLPADSPSLEGEALFKKAFPNDLLASSVVVIVRRPWNDDGLLDEDKAFIENTLVPGIYKIAEEEGGLASGSQPSEDEAEDTTPAQPETDPAQPADAASATGGAESAAVAAHPVADASASPMPPPEHGRSIITTVRTFSDSHIGKLLQSEDKKAALVIVGLTKEFMDRSNGATIAKIESLIADLENKNPEMGGAPPGLDLAISGSAAVGRDMIIAAADSARSTERWTILLVVALLLIIYRSPALAIIPLLTVFMSVEISIKLLTIMGSWKLLHLFSGINIYVTVILYGAGVDYCLFLIARYKEELDDGSGFDEALTNALGKVGAALSASAGTVICGIGMMVFANFGKFQQAGISIAYSLSVVLLAALTFTPSLLRCFGKWAFWPETRSERISKGTGWISASSPIMALTRRGLVGNIWDHVGKALLRKPGTIWLTSIAMMLPFAVIAVMCIQFLSYGLLSELPDDDPSVSGTLAVQEHFPAGATSPATLLIQNNTVEFNRTDGVRLIDEFTDSLYAKRDELQLADIRSVADPLGVEKAGDDDKAKTGGFLGTKIARTKAREYYVSDVEGLDGHVTRLDFVLREDPFSRHSISQLDRLQHAIDQSLPADLNGSQMHMIGATASIRDLKRVTDGDQIRIDILVLVGVFLILVGLLRKPAISAYLIVSVFFSYLVTLGVTFTAFWLLDPSDFAGLDWKVPMFLFTILIAVGEDYNIFLMTRIEEEQREYGPIQGVTVALNRTGRIISSCGIIMAGTFASLMAGSLMGMVQLGFALAFGVLLDTFVVRPILVPSYLILLHSGRFGAMGRFLGAAEDMPVEQHPAISREKLAR